MVPTSEVRTLPVIEATPENVAPYGRLIGDAVTDAIDIPYYQGRVVEGGDIGFRYRGQATIRTAQVLPGPDPDVKWLERHLHLTQLFIGLGTGSYVMVLGPPNHDRGEVLPDIAAARAVKLPPGCALLLKAGTWHDFPIAVDRPVTFLLANSEEVVTALTTAGRARELDEGDIRKISLLDRFGVVLRPLL